MGTVNAGGGTELTSLHINAFFNDETVDSVPLDEGHDLASVPQNLTEIVSAIPRVDLVAT